MRMAPESHESRLKSTVEYATPVLLLVGLATDVILGVAGGGEDHLGYSDPDFEFDVDELVPATLD